MRITLVRHGESEGNVDKSVLFDKPDHALDLSPLGREQAISCGAAMRERGYWPKRVWVSPYTRTRQTADGIMRGLGKERRASISRPDPSGWLPGYDVRESIHLVEQQFGLFDGYPTAQLEREYPQEYAHYAKNESFEGRFWARMPLGESRFDVCQRVHQFFGTIQRDADRHGIDDILVVSHGVTIRAFVMMWCHKQWEWFEKEPNPRNCSIRMIEDGVDSGPVWEADTNEPTKA